MAAMTANFGKDPSPAWRFRELWEAVQQAKSVGPAGPSAADSIDRLGGIQKQAAAGPPSMTELMQRSRREGPQQSATREAAARLEAPPSGTLPGEEQVTTQDTLRALSPAQQAALQSRYEQGGHSGTMSYDDWLSENFGDIPPKERVEQMRSVSVTAPRVRPAGDPTLAPGEQSQLAKERRLGGGVIPEGREPDHYSREQARTMSRNVRNPDIPMTRFGGTFTHNPDGSLSSRAADPKAMQLANAIAADPAQGPNSDSYITALAQAYGIDAIKYGDDLDLLRSDVMREHERHSQLAGKYEPVATGAGGMRYKPTAAFNQQLASNDLMRLARETRNRNQGLQGEINGMSAQDILGAIDAAALSANPESKGQMVRLRQLLRNIREANQHQAARNRAQNYNISNDLRNPNQAPGMGVRSLMEAVRSNNPLEMAAVHDIYGNQNAATQHRQLAAVQAQEAGNLAVAEEEARAAMAAAAAKGTEEEKMVGPALQEQLNAAFALGDDTQRYNAVLRIVEGTHPNASPEQHAEMAQDHIASHRARTIGPNDPFVQHRVNMIRASKNRDAFIRFVLGAGLANSLQQADWMFNNPEPPRSAVQVGRDAAQNARTLGGNVVGGVGGFFKGLFGG